MLTSVKTAWAYLFVMQGSLRPQVQIKLKSHAFFIQIHKPADLERKATLNLNVAPDTDLGNLKCYSSVIQTE